MARQSASALAAHSHFPIPRRSHLSSSTEASSSLKICGANDLRRDRGMFCMPNTLFNRRWGFTVWIITVAKELLCGSMSAESQPKPWLSRAVFTFVRPLMLNDSLYHGVSLIIRRRMQGKLLHAHTVYTLGMCISITVADALRTLGTTSRYNKDTYEASASYDMIHLYCDAV